MLRFMGSQRVGRDLTELKQLGDLMTYLKTLIRNIDSTKTAIVPKVPIKA